MWPLYAGQLRNEFCLIIRVGMVNFGSSIAGDYQWKGDDLLNPPEEDQKHRGPYHRHFGWYWLCLDKFLTKDVWTKMNSDYSPNVVSGSHEVSSFMALFLILLDGSRAIACKMFVFWSVYSSTGLIVKTPCDVLMVPFCKKWMRMVSIESGSNQKTIWNTTADDDLSQ